MFRKRLWMGLTSVLVFLLVVTIGGMIVAGQYEGAINMFLDVQTVRILNPGDEGYPGDPNIEEKNTEYFTSDYGEKNEANAKRLVEDSFDQTITEEIEGAALLMNKNNALPLEKTERISFFGHASVDPIHKGNSAGVDPMKGYRINFPTAMSMAGFDVNKPLTDALTASPTTRAKSNYSWMDCTNATNGIADGEEDISFYTPELRQSWEGQTGGTAIMVMTRCGQENYDMLLNNVKGFVKGDGMFDPPKYKGDKTGRSSLALIQEEIDTLQMLKEAKASGYFDKIVVLLNTGNTMEVAWLDSYDVDACVFTGLIGGVGAHGVAQLLSGDANFSGKIVDTYAVDSLSSPGVVNENENTQMYKNGDEVEAAVIGKESPFADTGRYMAFQAEGIYVGYKYYETRYEDYVLGRGGADSAKGASGGASEWKYENEVSYPFGHGLSYTNFTQTLDNVVWDADKDSYKVTVTVKNTGDTAGKSVVQVYAQTPYGEYEKANRVEKSAVQIVGFDKTKKLDPDESQTLTIDVERYLLASYDYVNAKGYILSEGDYYLAVGDNAHDALNNIIKAKKPDVTGLVDFNGKSVAGDASKTYKFNNRLDTTSYKKSETGVTVTNRFDDCDLNYWIENAGKYLSRSDWNGTYPTSATSVTATPEMIKVLAGGLYEKPEDSISVAEATKNFGKNVGLKMVDMMNVPYEDEETWTLFISQLSLDEMLNVLDDAQGNKWAVSEELGLVPMTLGDGINGPNACSINFPYEDTSGKYGSGRVGRISMTSFTGKAVLTGTFNKELYKARGKFIGEFGLWAGKHEFWTLGVNYHKTPFGGRNFEYCSEDPNMSYMALVPEAIEMEKRGVICSAKHAAGNDQETIRIGVSVFFNEQAWREGSLRASEGALRVAKVKSYMQNYERLGLVSCMRSEAFNIGVAYYEWGFRGSVITDCTNARLDGYQGDYIDQLVAGTDRFCMTNAQIAKEKVKSYLDKTDDGSLVADVFRAAKNYCYEFSRSCMMNGLSSDTIIERLTPWWVVLLVTLIVVLSVLSAAGVAMTAISKRREK